MASISDLKLRDVLEGARARSVFGVCMPDYLDLCFVINHVKSIATTGQGDMPVPAACQCALIN